VARSGWPALSGNRGWLRSNACNLTFLIHTEHQRPLRRTHIETDDSTHLFHKERVGGKFELFLTVRLQTKGLPDAPNGVMS
jgi:hypothetical protein